MNSYDYIEEIKRANGLDTDYKVCKLFGWSRNKVSQYKNGQTMDNEAARQVAEVLEIPVMAVIADMEAERQKDPAKKKAWKMLSKLSQQSGRATANLLFLLPFPAFWAALCILCKIADSRMIDSSDVSVYTIAI